MELREVLEALKKAGKITDEDIMEIVGPSNEFKQLVDAMHLLLCTKNHDTECSYDHEDVFEKYWEAPAHVEWCEKVNDFLSAFKLDDRKGLAAMAAALQIIGSQPRAVIYLITKYFNERPNDDQDQAPELGG